MNTGLRCFLLAGIFLFPLPCLQAASIWVEGEDAHSKNNRPHSWYDSVKKDVLSGGNWISHFSSSGEGLVGYQLDVPADGAYAFWLRANHVKAALSYRLDRGSWVPVAFKGNLRGSMNIASDNKPDLRFISWVKVGSLPLRKGRVVLEFRMHSESSHHGAIDCFCLTTEAWVPSGASKPGSGGSVKSRPADPKDAIWIEGEDADRRTTRPHSWYDSVKTDTLSGQKWLSHFNKEQPGFAEYRFEVLASDVFTFWLRANASAGARLSWSLDGSPYRLVEWKDGRGSMNIASDNKPDMRFISWFKVGKLNLKAGRHVITFRMDSPSHHHGAIDCFTFTRVPFVPSGANRPSVQSLAAGPGDWFPFVADDDPFPRDSVIDVSRLIEAPAGKHGFLKRDKDRLRFEKAVRPVKFWAIGSAPREMTVAQMKQAAKWYRKHGVNMVRQHTVIATTGLLDANGNFNKEKLDRYDRWFAAMKEEGIYSAWSVIYPHHGAFLQKHDGYDPAFFYELDRLNANRDGNRQPLAVSDFINLDRRLQDIALKYFRKLLQHRNPYTGLAYKDDPALAILEFQNESNAFFHSLSDMFLGRAPTFAKMMRGRFHAFVKEKYRTKEAVSRAWSKKWSPRDNWEGGELALQGAYHWGADGPLFEYRGQVQRTADYIEFYTRLQWEYYSRRQREVRELGFKGVTVTTAWHSGGPAASMANLFCDTAADMIDRHNYHGGGSGGHVITEGKVNNESHLGKPGRGLFNLALFQVEDRPFGVSEWTMMPPAPYKAEAAPLFAFYGMGLQGWDASYHFNCAQSRYGDGWPNLSKYASHTPHYMGQFPALAFAIHRNHLSEGEVVKSRQMSDKQLFAGKDVAGQARSAGTHDLKKLVGSPVTPTELIAIGRVAMGFSDQRPSPGPDLTPYWDQKRKILRSTTGELVWDYGNRIVEVRSSKTQGLIGFAEGKTIDLPGVELSLKTPFVSLIFTPLDDLELALSKQILITALARDKQTGSIYNADWSQLTQVGGPPLLLEPVQASIRLKGEPPLMVRPLDVYGSPKSTQVAVQADGSFAIDGTHRTFYYEIKR